MMKTIIAALTFLTTSALVAPASALADCDIDEASQAGMPADAPAKYSQQAKSLLESARLLAEADEESLCDEVLDKLEVVREKAIEAAEKERRERLVENAPRVVDSGGIMRSSKLVGRTVRNTEDEDLGRITEVVLNARSGSVAYVVVEGGGFMGLGQQRLAVPWNALRSATGDERIAILDLSEEAFENAQGLEDDAWPTTTVRQWPPPMRQK